MKLFLDTANVHDIKRWHETGIIDGVTTNPTHLFKEGGNARELILTICDRVKDGDVSVEVTEREPELIYTQAKAIAQLRDNIVVKIPCHRDYYGVIARLVREGVAVNVTLVFSLIQGTLMAKLGVRYISPFVGRLDDNGGDGIGLVEELCDMVNYYEYETQVLAASIRSVDMVYAAIQAGADVVTVPVTVLEKMTEHPLTDKGIDIFLSDWQKLGIKQFP